LGGVTGVRLDPSAAHDSKHLNAADSWLLGSPLAVQRWAAVLLEQYPDQVAATYSKKIEAIAKQPAWWVLTAAAFELLLPVHATAVPFMLLSPVAPAPACGCVTPTTSMLSRFGTRNVWCFPLIVVPACCFCCCCCLQDNRAGGARANWRLPLLRRCRPRN
jgi:hypothetical protein